MVVGKSVNRVDAYEKVTGRAKYTDDLAPKNCLIAKVVRSTIANGRVLSIDHTKALAIEGVLRVISCFDVPEIQFSTAGHPWSTDPAHQDTADRLLLNKRVRMYGDDVAVVVATSALAACLGAAAVQITYEEYPALLTPEQAMANLENPLHLEYPNNILAHTRHQLGEKSFAQLQQEDASLLLVEGSYSTQTVQHCHIETAICYAYMEGTRIVVVSSTQIPHIARRVIGQALGLGWGQIRVIKPYIGGGFGNKQEVLYEPLCAYLTRAMGGLPVKIELTREEVFASTRVRHAISFQLKTLVRPDGVLVARRMEAVSNQGGYASHGHAIVSNSETGFRQLYGETQRFEADAKTVYTNISTGGAMRGYGIPQVSFAMESHMEDIALALAIDPIELRLKNCIQQGYVDPLNGITCHSCGIDQCIALGKKAIDWEQKRAAYQNQKGAIRRGVGMALFGYKTGVHPISLELAGARLALNQDGSVTLTMGATEIGQGADTVFTQMAAETIGIPMEAVHILSTQDTDSAPFDTGAYASRQTYVSGTALKKAAEIFKEKLLQIAAQRTGCTEALNIVDGQVIVTQTNQILAPLSQIALESFYHMEQAQQLTVEQTFQMKDNAISFGVCFVEIEVDIALGKITILNIINVHDSGRIINPKLATAQVHGGMSMGLGYALSERLLFDQKGKPLNNNLLDYKLPTAMDTPELQVAFADIYDPSGPYGNKSLGEPPAIPAAPAIRNAVLHATAVGLNSLPLYPQYMVEEFQKAGLIQMKEGAAHV